ncbi:MAG: DUF4279 domain-containing protein [Deltaproteobacteria bacterium]|nr:DUF4279 domain-containing protein [Deltaproteobacteria bacterium]
MSCKKEHKIIVYFFIAGFDIDPDEIEDKIGIKATPVKGKAKTKTMRAGNRRPGYWSINTKGKVESEDVNEHFSYLFAMLFPKRETIVELSRNWEISFDVFWTSTRLFAGDGPQLSKETCAGVAQFNAEIGFDIYPEPDDGENKVV